MAKVKEQPDEEMDETEEQESSETPSKQMKEESSNEEEPTEEKESGDSEHIKVPEHIQQACGELLAKCDSKECLDYIHSAVSRKGDEYREAESAAREAKRAKAMKSQGVKTPSNFSTADMPSSY